MTRGSLAGFGAETLARHRASRPEAMAIRPLPTHPELYHATWELLDQDATYIGAMIANTPDFREASPDVPVAWLGPNDSHMLGLLFACARLGIALVPLNWRLSVEELRWIEADCGFRLLFVPGARGARRFFEHPFLNDFLQRHRGDPRYDVEDPLSFAAALIGSSYWDQYESFCEGAPDRPLLIGYTSGTTGRPKGAVLTQAAFAANAAHAQALFGITAEDRVLTVLPLFHVGGLNIQTVPALLAGAEVLLPARFDPDGFFDICAEHRPTLTLLVPAVMQALVAHPRWASADLSSLRAIGAGSSEVPPHLIAAFHARGIPVQQVYGATETGPIAIAQTVEEALVAPGSIGHPVPGVEARLAPDTSEIMVRGANVMRGYLGAAPLSEGWFATGDIGRIDAAGRWWFVDRRNHVIISGGENIYPAEVERVLVTAPGVVECAVVGRADPRWGEVPVAVVVPGEGFDPAAALAQLDGRLARFKHPRDVIVVEGLPRTALGKVATAALRALVSRS